MARASGGRWRIWLNAILAAGCGLGCRGMLGHPPIPEDPLFARRKPVESKAVTAAPMAIAFVEPPVPTDARTAVASRDTAPGSVRGILTSQPATRKTDDRKHRHDKSRTDAPADEGPMLPPQAP
ncbi:MAG: hypothetical protein FJ271_11440 [Planctomycetes bacterium]|nr:hypothetical protein [Planctomycetota bacterium]